MRKLPPRSPPPAKLQRLQASANQHACSQIASGVTKVAFRQHVYGCIEVREALDDLQSGTCIYCEAFLRPVTVGHVDHYRPKGGYTLRSGAALVQPGYFHFAYIWENLVLSCPSCNDGYKKNHFPLADESKRNTTTSDISQESPMLINAFDEQPRDYIRFREDIPYAVGGSSRGNATIDILSLDRQDLNDARRLKLKMVYVANLAMSAYATGSNEYKIAKEAYGLLTKSDGEYASCVSDYTASGSPHLA